MAAKSSSSSNPNTVTHRGLIRTSCDDDDNEEVGSIESIVDKVIDDVDEGAKKIVQLLFGDGSIAQKVDDFIRADDVSGNPSTAPIPLLENDDSLVDSDGRKLVSGSASESGTASDASTIDSHGEETVEVPISLTLDEFKSIYGDIRPGAGSIIPYNVQVVIFVDAPVFGRMKIPLDKSGHSGVIPLPWKPDVDIEKITFHHFSSEETTATIHLSLENKNDYDMGLNLLQCEMWLGHSVVVVEFTDSTKIGKKGMITKMQIPVKFRLKHLGYDVSGVWDVIRNRDRDDRMYTIKGTIDVSTPFGNMKLPIEKVDGTTKFRKDDDDEDEE